MVNKDVYLLHLASVSSAERDVAPYMVCETWYALIPDRPDGRMSGTVKCYLPPISAAVWGIVDSNKSPDLLHGVDLHTGLKFWSFYIMLSSPTVQVLNKIYGFEGGHDMRLPCTYAHLSWSLDHEAWLGCTEMTVFDFWSLCDLLYEVEIFHNLRWSLCGCSLATIGYLTVQLSACEVLYEQHSIKLMECCSYKTSHADNCTVKCKHHYPHVFILFIIMTNLNKMLSYRRETALQGAL